MKLVTDEWLKLQLIRYEQTIAFWDTRPLYIALRELQQRRAQRCETCAHTDPDPNVAPDHVWCGFYGMAQLGTISCPNWEGKEVEG